MDEEIAKRIECKIDYIAGLLMGAVGIGIALAVVSLKLWGSWSEWGAGIGAVILPAYLISKYRDLCK